MQDHVILCGLGRVGWHVLELLKAAGTPVVVIDSRCAPNDARLAGTPLVQGDCQSQACLEKADVFSSRGVIILPSAELICITTALLVRRLNPTARVVVRVFNENLVRRLGAAVTNVVALSTSALAAPLVALTACTTAVLGVFRLDSGEKYHVAELTAKETSGLCGVGLASLGDSHGVAVVAHAVGSESRLLAEIEQQTQIKPGDRLIVCGKAEVVGALLAQGSEESLPELLWAGFVRRFGRMIWQTLGEIDVPVKICTSVLLVVIIASTLVFHLSIANETIPDAVYRTISLMATGADMGGRELPPGGWEKVFVSMLRLAGAALTAAFTAILTNYLVRAHLGGALESRKIPEGGHVVVCGMGNNGFRVVQELLKQGEKVVAIEKQPDNPFIATARRQNVPVVVGDATLREVLQQARVGTARAVVAATTKEIINLEIALLVRELNASQRVVLLLVDPRLAQTMRETANIRNAVSIPALAAPAFVAALLGDRVRAVFSLAGKLLAVVDLIVADSDAFFVGQQVRRLADDYNFLPIHLADSAKNARLPAPEVKLGVGDQLTVIISLGDLQRLLRRDPPGRA